MKTSALLLAMLLAMSVTLINAQDFSTKEKAVIYTNAVKVLDDYQSIINQIGEFTVTDVEKAKSSSESFLELFVNRQVLIYNDLDPAHQLSEFYEAETYASNIILWYPDGLTIRLNLDDARVSDIMKHEESVYSLDLMVNKTISGNYLNQTPNKNTEELTFRIAFGLDGNTSGNFRIAGIRSASSNYFIDYSQVLKQVNLEEFTAEDLNKIRSEINTILNDYVNYLSLLGDMNESAEDKEFYKASFLKLFQGNDTKLYNDIMPEPESSLIPATDYLTSYMADFPSGINNISVNADSAKFGNIMKADDNSLFTFVTVNKFFSGSYKGKEPFRNMSPLIFRISFNASGKTFTNFHINSIDFASVNFYEADAGAQVLQNPELQISPVTRKGFALSFLGAFGQTRIDDNDLKYLTLDNSNHAWNLSPLYGYVGALGLSYYLNDHFALRTGAEFNKYAETFSLEGSFTDDILSSDINEENYYKIITADYDSLITINYLTTPLLLNFTTGKPGKVGFYIETGAKFSFPVSTNYSTSGDYKFYGYYPTAPYVHEYIDDEELGFYTRENIDEKGDITISSVNIAFYSSAGINLPLGYYTSISIGPEVTIGLSDLLGDKSMYTDIFGRTYDHKTTKIKNFGIRISLAYKL